ncbi:FAD-dependent oxidoreductase [Brevibacterium spongiae]|uniref:FAD-dependent monooxygenase n=1 Tax=Brevibacterium spongiae TaxID=2909672 RepID=A0ABY5SWV6_9MICO|nr:NAD(P)/FAD-dependent oxidoreductase [Brevibacterium spongiae]UVI37521.1 FAD-dependent monooxygenase [Brevibacterium spongiae]
MITAATVDEQLKAVTSDEPRILIVGAGIAGITVAQLLRAHGLHPVLIDRSADAERMIGDNRAGYMLALMPMVDPVIDELGCRESYLEASVGIDRYIAHAHTGRVLRQDHLGALLAEYGDYRGISRAALLTVLTGSDCPIAFDTAVGRLSDDGESVSVTWAEDHPREERSPGDDFDVVVIADGMNSRTRGLVSGGPEEANPACADAVDTAWGGWVCWADADADVDAVDEVWGDGFFLGMYPVKDGIGVFLGCPDSRQPLGPRRFADEVRGRLRETTPRIDACLDAIAAAGDPFFWPLRDSRTQRWVHGRTVLLGDAAAGFLPTAGIGAGMAMEAAGVLAAELRTFADGHTDSSSTVSAAASFDPDAVLKRFESRQRPRVEAAHDNSRSLARMMFDRSRIVAAVRDQVFRFVSLKIALGPIVKLLKAPVGRM